MKSTFRHIVQYVWFEKQKSRRRKKWRQQMEYGMCRCVDADDDSASEQLNFGCVERWESKNAATEHSVKCWAWDRQTKSVWWVCVVFRFFFRQTNKRSKSKWGKNARPVSEEKWVACFMQSTTINDSYSVAQTANGQRECVRKRCHSSCFVTFPIEILSPLDLWQRDKQK